MLKKDNVFLNSMSDSSLTQNMKKFARTKRGVRKMASQVNPKTSRVVKKKGTRGRKVAEEYVPTPNVGKIQDRINTLKNIDKNLFERLISAKLNGPREAICPASGHSLSFDFLYNILRDYEEQLKEHVAKWHSQECEDLQEYNETRVKVSDIDAALVSEIANSKTITEPCCKRTAVFTAFETEFYADDMDLDIEPTTSYEILNVRCSSCGRSVAQFTQVVDDMLRSGEYDMEEILNYLNIRNICCRKNFVVPPVYSGYTESKEYLMTPDELKMEEQKLSDNTEIYTFDWSTIPEDVYNEYMESLDAYQKKGISVPVVPRSQYSNMDTMHVSAGKFFTGVVSHEITSMVPES